MQVAFGNFQTLTSARMARRPWLSKLIAKVFGYTNVGNFARSLAFRRAVQTLPLAQMKDILDLGCGFGEYAVMMAKALPQAEVTGLELHQRKTDLLREIAQRAGADNLNPHLGLIETLPAGKKFDLIYSVDVFEHILEHQMPFAQARERLKPGGYLMVKMPSQEQSIIAPERWFGEHKVWLDEEHIGQVYELEDLKQRFEREGFEVVYASYSDGWFSRLGWELSYFGNKLGAVFQLAFLPLAKLLVRIDHLQNGRNKGNAIQVIGRKTLK
ncbi:MAG: class I SAM-dependent methyltransferase [Bacteroidota bacterium]